MSMFEAAAFFLLTQWLWSIIWGINQLCIAWVLLFILLKLWDHLSFLKAFLLSTGLSISAYIVFFTFGYVLLIMALDIQYIPPANAYEVSESILVSALFLAGIYSAIQCAFVLLIRKRSKLHWHRVGMSILFSNILSALIMYKLVQHL